MWKKMCLASVSLIVLIALLPSALVLDVGGAETPEGFLYSVNTSGNASITGYTGTTESLIIPDTIDGNQVRYIGDSAFKNNTTLKKVTIPDSVTIIYDSAFEGCTSLTSVVIGDGIVSIGSYAFEGCTSLTKIFIPKKVNSLGTGAFMDCTNLRTIKFMGNAPTNVGQYWITDTHSDLQIYYFDDAEGFTNPWNGISPVGQQLFIRELYSGTFKITGYNGPGGDMIIPDEIGGVPVKYIADNAFQNNFDITSVTIPDSVISIGISTFAGCTSVTDVSIGNGVASIGDNAFAICSSMVNVTIGNGVTSIGENVFALCSSLTNVVIPDSVTSIGANTFISCTSLTSVSIGDGVTGISNSLFQSCSELTGVVIPDSVTSIGNASFKNCTKLTDITIPDGVTIIGNDTFEGCSGLTSMRFMGNAPSVGINWANTGTALKVYCIYGKTGFDVSPWTEMTLVVVTPPGAPAGLEAVAGVGSTSLTWTAPADDGGSEITGYEIWFGVGSESSSWTLFGDTNALTATVTGLNNGTEYHFGVKAVNFVGTSAFSSASATTHSVPGAPSLTAVAGDAKVVLTWTEPANGGSAITGYEIWYKSAGTDWTLFGDVSILTATVTGLTNGTEYEFRIAAENAVGVGAVSNEAASTPKSDVLAILSDPVILAIAAAISALVVISVAVVLRRK